MGWIYGSQTEDVLTGLTIHTKGWRSEMVTPDPIAFTGCAPAGGPNSMTQQKRWVTGVLEFFFSKKSPILGTMFGKLQFRQCLGYMWMINWGLRSVPEVCYAALLAYCTITNSNLFPKVSICDNHYLFYQFLLFLSIKHGIVPFSDTKKKIIFTSFN